MADPTIEDVKKARERVSGLVHHTPLVPSFALSRLVDADVRFKLESFQDTRSFKVRGAANAILERMENRTRPERLVTFSTGNHGRATAYVASKLGIPTTVCMSNRTTPAKQAALEEVGADLRLVGESQDEAQAHAMSLAEAGMTFIDPINDPATTAGHGTIAMELVEDWPEVDTVVVPVSGGALVSGIAVALQSLNPDAKVIAVSMDRGAAMHASLQDGHPVQVEEVESLADCLQGGISLDNTHTFRIVRDMVDEFVLVTEEQIAMAMTEALIEERLVLEGAGATPIAALMYGERSLFGDSIALIASGGNVAARDVWSVAAERETALAELIGQ